MGYQSARRLWKYIGTIYAKNHAKATVVSFTIPNRKGVNVEYMEKILIIEDEQAIAEVISIALSAKGYKIVICETAQEGLNLIASHCPDVVLLDLGLPDMDGILVLKKLREWTSVPVIVVSARTEESEKVMALDSGADDYITKPFGTSELLARIRTAIRHSIKDVYLKGFKVGDLVIDFDKHLVLVENKKVHLTQIEYKIVAMLAQNAGKVLNYESIINEIWGPYADTDNRILRVNMVSIRRKIEKNPADPQYIFTEVGVGYCMKDAEIKEISN